MRRNWKNLDESVGESMKSLIWSVSRSPVFMEVAAIEVKNCY